MKNPHAVAMAKLANARGAARLGGLARRDALSPERRRAIAKKAIKLRWDRVKANRKKS